MTTEGGRGVAAPIASEAVRTLFLEHLQHRRGCIQRVSLRSSPTWTEKLLQCRDDSRAPSSFLRGKLEAACILDKGAPRALTRVRKPYLRLIWGRYFIVGGRRYLS